EARRTSRQTRLRETPRATDLRGGDPPPRRAVYRSAGVFGSLAAANGPAGAVNRDLGRNQIQQTPGEKKGGNPMIRALLASALVGVFAVETPVQTPARTTPTPTPSASAAANARRLFLQDIAWSPDGRHFAFSRYEAVGPYTDNNWTIWIADRDGSNPRV